MIQHLALNKLILTNFKGAHDLTVLTNGMDLNVSADNGIGKTTIMDAGLWLLTGKDSENKVDFDIKTMIDGVVQHNLEHSVEGHFTYKGETIKLKRVYKEDWETKRGAGDKVFTGHTTKYYINGVSCGSKKEYDEFVATICQPKVYQMLSDPTYTPTKLSLQDLRSLLLEVCGNVTDADVIASNKKLAELPEILGSHSIEKYQRLIKDKKSEISEQRKNIPTRIDQLNKGLTPEEMIEDVTNVKLEIEDLRERKASRNAGGAIAEKTAVLNTKKAELTEIETRLKQDSTKDYDKVNEELRGKQTEANDVFSRLNKAKSELEETRQKIARFARQREDLRQEYLTENAKTFEYDGAENCPTCGQALPADEVAAAREKATNDFNAKKAQKLEGIQTEGRGYKSQQEELEQTIESKELAIADLTKEEEKANLACSDLRAKLSSMTSAKVGFESNEEHVAKLREIQAVEQTISDLRSGASTDVSVLDNQIKELQTKVDDATASAQRMKRRSDDLKKISDYEKEQKTLATEYEKYERHGYLIEQFIKTKVEMLTTKINSKFKLVSFKLFEEQVNEGIRECCEATIDGRPYSTALSNAERINAGLDIINTLSEHYGFAPPIFIDNKESVSRPLATHGQQIRLIVDDNYQQLFFESNEELETRKEKERKAKLASLQPPAQQELISA